MIDWGEELESLKEHEERVSGLSPSASGDYIHSLLEDEYGNIPGLEFEKPVMAGRADLITDDMIYEFKTKSDRGIESAPYIEDFEQLRGYLDSPDVQTENGQVIYINRDDFGDVRQFAIDPHYNTGYMTDGGLPENTDFDIYEVTDL